MTLYKIISYLLFIYILSFLFNYYKNNKETFITINPNYGSGTFTPFYYDFTNKNYLDLMNKYEKCDFNNNFQKESFDKSNVEESLPFGNKSLNLYGNDIYENEIISTNKDIIIKNKYRMLNEMDNDVFDKELKILINNDALAYVKNLEENDILEIIPRNEIKKDNNEILLKYDKIEKYVLKKINSIKKLKFANYTGLF
jgi:hypothetical protein